MNSEIKTKTYRFILTPLDTIFFGGEKSPFKQEYFRKSAMFPQQTAVLGFLRYEVLKRANLLGSNPDKSEWARLIGSHSWNGLDQSFGLIDTIGPVTIYDKNSKTDLYSYRNPNGLEFKGTSIKCCYGQIEVNEHKSAYFSNVSKLYNTKIDTQFSEILTDFNNIDKSLECEVDINKQKALGIKIPELSKGLFIRDIQTGITKSYDGATRDESYFKTLFWRMVPGYAYSFKVKIKQDEKIKNWVGHSIVTFGGEASKYTLEVVDDDIFPTLPSTIHNIVVLTSDSYLSNNIFDSCDFAVCDSINFRNLKTSVRDERFTNRPVLKWYRKDQQGESKVEGRNTEPAKVLMKKGSILFISDKENFLKQISNPAFQNIGYNYFRSFSKLYQTS